VDVTKAPSLPALGPYDELLALNEAVSGLELDEEDGARWVLDGIPPKPGATSKATAASNKTRGKAARTPPLIPLPTLVPPPPDLTKGDKVSLLFGDERFTGCFTSSKIELNDDGAPTRISRIVYDAIPGKWPTTSQWHCLDNEDWFRV